MGIGGGDRPSVAKRKKGTSSSCFIIITTYATRTVVGCSPLGAPRGRLVIIIVHTTTPGLFVQAARVLDEWKPTVSPNSAAVWHVCTAGFLNYRRATDANRLANSFTRESKVRVRVRGTPG